MAFIDLDDDRTDDDEALHSLIGVRTVANVDALAEDRHVGSGWAWADRPVLSTHPDHDWGIPLLFIAEPGADTVRAVVTCEAIAAPVDVSLEVAGSVGAAVTVPVSGAVEVVEVVAALPATATATTVYRGALRLRSHVGALKYTRGVEEHTDVTLHTTGSTIGPLTWEACHFVAEYTGANYEPSAGDRPRFYLGSWHRASHGSHVDFQGWPSAQPGFFVQDNAQVAIYDVGRLDLHGVALSYTGAIGAVRPASSTYAPRSLARSSGVLGLSAALARIYETRPHWYTSGGADGLAGRTRLATATELVVFDGLITIRPDVVGLELTALAAGAGGPEDLNATVEFIDPATGAVVVSRSGGSTVSPSVGGQARRLQVADEGTLATYGVARYLGGSVFVGAWGAGDLAYCGPGASDLPRYSRIRARFGLAGLVSGFYRLRVTLPISAAALVVTPAIVREVIET